MSKAHLSQVELDELLRPPTDAEVESALARFAADVQRHYGDRLKGLYLFGSRARGDHGPDSDADVAIVLADQDWQFWDEKHRLLDLAFDHGMNVGLHISPWPFFERIWDGSQDGRFARMASKARADAKRIEAAA